MFQHFCGRFAMLPVKTINWNAQTRMFIALPFDHVVLCLAKKSMLRTEECAKPEQISVVPLEDIRCVLEMWRNRRRMKQRTDACPAEAFRPKLAEMLKWKLNTHDCESYHIGEFAATEL